MEAEGNSKHWWGESEFELESADRWEIGNLDLWLHRSIAEWRVAHSWTGEEDRGQWRRESGVAFPDEGMNSERYAVRQTGGIVLLRALTADRSVIARPRVPLRVPPGQETRIFVSAPLWLEILVGPGQIHLLELPTRRLSNTWFGPSTREGEVAYALKTGARTRAEELPTRPYRFATPIVIDNQASETLVVERLNLPVPHLSIFSLGEALWSEEVRMLRTESGDLAELDVREGPPPEAEGAVRLGEPRRESERGHLFRAFSSILRLNEESS